MLKCHTEDHKSNLAQSVSTSLSRYQNYQRQYKIEAGGHPPSTRSCQSRNQSCPQPRRAGHTTACRQPCMRCQFRRAPARAWSTVLCPGCGGYRGLDDHGQVFRAVYGGLVGSIYATGNEDTLQENPPRLLSCSSYRSLMIKVRLKKAARRRSSNSPGRWILAHPSDL